MLNIGKCLFNALALLFLKFNNQNSKCYFLHFIDGEIEAHWDVIIAQGHGASKWQTWDSNSGPSAKSPTKPINLKL